MTASCSPAGKRLIGIKNVRLVFFSMSIASSPMLIVSAPSAIQPLLTIAQKLENPWHTLLIMSPQVYLLNKQVTFCATEKLLSNLLSKYTTWPRAKPDFKHVCCSQCILGSHTAEPEQLPPERRLQQCPRWPQPVLGDAMFWTI